MTEPTGPLDGIRILDLTNILLDRFPPRPLVMGRHHG